MPDSKIPKALVAHQCPGRTRIRIPEKKGDRAFFAEMEKQLAGCAGVTRVECRSETGSVLVFHGRSVAAGALADHGREQGLFEMIALPSHNLKTVRQYASAGIKSFERSLIEVSDGLLDLDSVFLLALLGFAVRQASRGQVFGPAVTLVWYAQGIIRSRRGSG